MITNGRFYSGLTGNTSAGNGKYSSELKACIEDAGELCLQMTDNVTYAPGMLLGSIQSGKTRGFIGLMALLFDNDFDMTIILTKCSKALVQQTVKRMTGEFDSFKTGNATIGDVVAQDILDIDFSNTRNMEDKEGAVVGFLNRYKRKKRIIVVKKQADNVDRMNMFIEQLVKGSDYKRILIVDDEADITSIGYEKKFKDANELTLRRISGAINTARIRLNSKIEYAVIQVTATPYALYLQPELFSSEDIMPVKPVRTIVMPTGEGYIGGRYYFIDSQDEQSENYNKAKFLPHIVSQEEMEIINGTAKNSGRNSRIKDGRTVKKEDFIQGQSTEPSFALHSLREWIFDIIVGTAILQNNEGFEEYYASAVMHAATTKATHKAEVELLNYGISEIRRLLSDDPDDKDVLFFIKQAYNGLKESVESYGVLKVPEFAAVKKRVGQIIDGKLEGLITEIDVKEVNSDSDIMKLLNDDGELRLESSITIFVGGQVLDRGITIPNMLNFFYGRDPKTMQQDTVVQHCRMFGYRIPELLSVTRFYTTNRLFNNIREITIRDEILRERIARQDESNVIYLEAGGDIKPCSPAKILASDINNIMPQKRYLPVGFNIRKNKAEARKIHDKIVDIIDENKGFLKGAAGSFSKGDSTDGKYVMISPETAMDLIRAAYSVIDAEDDGICNTIEQIEPAFWFSMSELVEKGESGVALIVRRDRKLSKYKQYGNLYQDAPDDGNNEGALAKKLREQMPVLVLTEQKHPDWNNEFWWPVYYTPNEMNVGIYAENKAGTHVGENMVNIPPRPVEIERFEFIDNVGMNAEFTEKMNGYIEKVADYYNNLFNMNCVTVEPDKRKKVVCPIYLDEMDPSASTENVNKAIEKYEARAMKILEIAKVEELQTEIIANFFNKTLEGVLTDEESDAAFRCIEQLAIKKYMKNNLIHILEAVNDLLYRRNEAFGFFVWIEPRKFEIHIYKGVIEYYLDDKKIWNKDNVLTMIVSSIAHEIFHAYHFADVVTESGRWLYTRKGFKKQTLVQEALAEYFNLSFSKSVQSDPELQNIVTIIREMRDINNYPDDPYPGALIIEKNDENGCGKNNKYFAQAYELSLKDMYAAGDILLSIAPDKK